MPIVGYVEAIASERASFQQQVDDIQRAYNHQQKAGDTRLPITRDQALSDAKTNHAVECAALIDTFQEQKLMRVRTKKGNYCRTMHVGDNRVMYNTLAFPTINVDKLIDFAATRMSIN